LIATRSQKRLSDLITGIFHMRERQAEFIRLGTTCQSNPSGPVSEITEGENLYSKIEMNLETDHGDSKLTDGKTRFRKRAIEVAHQSTNLHYGWHQILTLAPFLSTFPPETIERVRHKMSLIFPQ
jgi:hypothetical protein